MELIPVSEGLWAHSSAFYSFFRLRAFLVLRTTVYDFVPRFHVRFSVSNKSLPGGPEDCKEVR
jgi:hypothetical protein